MADDMDYPGVDLEEEEKRKPFATPGIVPSPGDDGMGIPAPAPPDAPNLNMPPAPDNPVTPFTSKRQPAPPPRPQPSDFQPPVLKHPWLKRLAIGAAAFGSPQQGEAAHRHVFEEPREIANQQYQAASGAYDTELNQGLAQRKELREQGTAESQAGLRKAEADALEPKVMVKVPWQDEPIAMSQKGAEGYYKTQQTGANAAGVADTHGETARDVANINAGAKKAFAGQHPPIRVMGNRTYERTPDGAWKDIGAAPPRTEPGNFAPVFDPESGSFTGWVNPKSKHFIGPDEISGAGGAGTVTPVKPAGATQSRRDQASAIDRASTGLISTIEQHRNKIGNVESILKSAFLGTPIADPELAGVASEIQSYAALQPTMHGFRGQDALREFSHMIGGIPKDPDALIASIKGIQKTAGYINPNISKSAETPAKGGFKKF